MSASGQLLVGLVGGRRETINMNDFFIIIIFCAKKMKSILGK